MKTNYKIKQTATKKTEIITHYEKELKTILEQYSDDKVMQLEQKKQYLKQCNEELSRNIFFTKEESLKIVQKLATM